MKKSVKTFIQLITLLVIFQSTAFAQVSGTIYDEQTGETLPFANIILANAKDTSIIVGDFSKEDGNFSFTNTTTEEVVIFISMMGYMDFYSSPFTLQKDKPIILDCNLQSSAHQLKGVTVVAKVPFLEQSAGKLTVNVAKNISGINGSMLDVLKKVPGILVINNKVSLAGSSVSILIDGQPTEHMDIETLLSEMSADDIEKIEVISQAGAAMDASGSGGVINIILKKNKLKGTNGSISAGIGRGDLTKYSSNLRLNHRTKAININSSLGYSHNSSWSSFDINRSVGEQQFVQSSYDPNLPETLNGTLGLDWDINEQNSMGVSMKAFTGDNDKTKTSLTDISSEKNLIESVRSANQVTKNWNYLNGDLYYNLKIDTSGQKLNFSANYNRYHRASLNLTDISSSIGTDYPAKKNDSPGLTTTQSFKLDYSLPINEKLFLTAGVKYSQARTDNELKAFTQKDGLWETNTNLSNHYIFNENIKAAYTQISFTGKKFDFKAGLRYEKSNANGYSATLDSTNTSKIGQLFPSASLSFPLNSTFGIAAAYSYRIKRPTYSSLNPFIYSFDPYSYEKGNPYLRPALTHSAKLSLTYEKQPFFNLSYKRTKDAIVSVTGQDEATGASYLTTTNMKSKVRYGASMFFPLSFVKNLEGYGGIMANYDLYTSDYLGELYNKKKLSFVTFLQGSVKLPKDFKFEFGGWYQSAGLQGIMEHDNLFSTSFGIEKKMMNKQLSVKVSFEDAFYKYWTADVNYANMDIDVTAKWETKVINLQITYTFGNRFLKKGKKRKSSGSDEAKRIQVGE